MKKIVLLSLLFLIGCDSVDDGPAFNIAGSWDIAFTGAASSTGSIDITQSGKFLDGTMSNDLGMDFNVSGTIKGKDISLTLVETPDTGYAVTVDMTTPDGYTASGTWTDNLGNSGTCSAVKW